MQANAIAAPGPANAYASARPTTRPRVTRGLARWFAPDLALVAAIAALIYLVASFGGATALFRDADAGWHIRAGERIVSSATLPHADPFSFSRPAAVWFAWEWAADALTGALHSAMGLAGVAWFYALAIAGSVWMWVRLAWKAGGHFLVVCAFAAPMLSTVNLHWLARPHVISWLFLLATVWACEAAGRNKIAAPQLLAACLTACLWANLHGSFFFAVLIPLTWAAGQAIARIVWNSPANPSAFINLAIAAAAGTFLNPNGWHLHQHVFAYLTNTQLLDRIGEFQSFNFHAEGAIQIVLALLLCMIGGVSALAIHRADRFLLTLLLTAGALRTARMLPVAALLLLPLAAGSISEVLRSAQVSRRFRKTLDAFLGYGDRLRTLDRGFTGFALVPFLAIAMLGIIRAAHPAFPADQFPVAASAQIARLSADARLFSSDKFGGYLIYRFNGERKVFFDGRSDFYGLELLRQYGQIIQLRPGWQQQFDQWNFTHALMAPDAPLSAALLAAGWHELYRDGVAVLLEKEGLS